MRIVSKLLLLIVTLCLVEGKVTQFSVNFCVECLLSKKLPDYWFQLDLFELDLLGNNHLGSFDKKVINHSRQYSGTVKGSADGDGLLDNYYELKLKVQHNCAPGNKKTEAWVTIQKDESDCPVGKDECVYTGNIPLEEFFDDLVVM